MTGTQVLRLLRTPLTMLALLAVLSWGAWWGYKQVTAKPVKPPLPCATQQTTQLTPSMVSVKVLNGGTKSGLASDVARGMRERGFKVTAVGNVDEQVPGVMVIVGGDKDSPEVQLVASHFPEYTFRSDGRTNHSVDVLLGTPNANNPGVLAAGNFKTVVPVPGGEICLPPTPTPSGGAPVPTPSPTR